MDVPGRSGVASGRYNTTCRARNRFTPEGDRQHHLMGPGTVVPEVRTDDVVRIPELEGLLMPIPEHGTIGIIRAVSTSQPERILVAYGRGQIHFYRDRARVLDEE